MAAARTGKYRMPISESDLEALTVYLTDLEAEVAKLTAVQVDLESQVDFLMRERTFYREGPAALLGRTANIDVRDPHRQYGNAGQPLMTTEELYALFDEIRPPRPVKRATRKPGDDSQTWARHARGMRDDYTPDVFRFVISTSQDVDPNDRNADQNPTLRWRATYATSIEGWRDDPDLIRSTPRVGLWIKDETPETFLAWIEENAPSAVIVQRTPPIDDERHTQADFTWEVLISHPDEAEEFLRHYSAII